MTLNLSKIYTIMYKIKEYLYKDIDLTTQNKI